MHTPAYIHTYIHACPGEQLVEAVEELRTLKATCRQEKLTSESLRAQLSKAQVTKLQGEVQVCMYVCMYM